MTIRIFLFCVAASVATAAVAQESVFDSLAKSAGLMAPPADPPDFVKASRASAPSEYIPAFAPPPEPHSRVKTAAELKAMDTDLQRASDARTAKASKKRSRAAP